ncbi:LOW QUALITY PROTEIN: oxidoreductase, partial [Streptomyces griseoflavus Tu4000]
MSTTGASADPLAALGSLPGVADSVESVRKSVDRVYGHRVMRRRSNEITSEAALRGARGTAALSGADWALEEVRRRSDFSGDGEARTMGAALRLTAEAGQLLSIWRQSPLRVLARLHLVAAAEGDGRVGRPRQEGEPVDEPLIGLALPSAAEAHGRLEGLSELIIAGGSAPALVTAAVVHGELLALRPLHPPHNGLDRAHGRAHRPGRQRSRPQVGMPRRGGPRRTGPRGLPGGAGGLRLRHSRGRRLLDRPLRARGRTGGARVDGGVRGAPARSRV